MAIHYSPSMKGFYDSTIHQAVPGDAVEISGKRHQELLAEQSAGKEFRFDGGRVYATERAPPSSAEVKARNNKKLKARLEELDTRSVRALREFILTGNKARLEELDNEAAKLRRQISS